jgi:hypothetical protein
MAAALVRSGRRLPWPAPDALFGAEYQKPFIERRTAGINAKSLRINGDRR